jgi:hypothetical protein
MRVDVKLTDTKKKDGIGVGFIIAFVMLGACAYTLGHRDYAGVFPHYAERAFTNFRNETEFLVDGARKILDGVYTTVAGR